MAAHVHAILLVLAAVGCSTPAPGRATSTGKELATLLPARAELNHVARINPRVYRGGQPRKGGYAALERMGIRTVVNLRRLHDYEEEAQSAGLSYVHIPLRADLVSTPPTDEQVEAFFSIVLDPARQPVFFHCAHGRDRTGTMAAIYRIEVDGWSNEEAIEEMEAFGYNDFYKDLKRFVRAYEPRGYAQKSNWKRVIR